MSRRDTVKWRSAGRSHVGAVRTINEDAVLDSPEHGVWAVADGMGGHEAGDKASASVVAALAGVSEATCLADLIAEAKACLSEVNTTLGESAARQSIMAGSTVVAMLSQGTHIAVLWAGDSRAYLWRHGRLAQLTEDHSRVQQLVSSGVIRAEEAESHPEANVITRAIGVSPAVELDTEIIEARHGDTYLLCSDGLYRCVAEDDMAGCLEAESCDEACQSLIGKAIDGGGDDNISAVVIRPGMAEALDDRGKCQTVGETVGDLTIVVPPVPPTGVLPASAGSRRPGRADC